MDPALDPFAGIAELADALRSAEATTALTDPCVQYFTSQGIAMASYHHLPPLGAKDFSTHITVAAVGFPDAWVQRYVAEELYQVDPIPKTALSMTEPFRWSESRHNPDLSPEEQRYLDQLDAAGIGDGLAVPVFGPHGRNGYVGLGFGQRDFSVSEKKLVALQWACQLGHLAYCRLLHAKAPDGTTLTRREQEIMEWVTRGKSNASIGIILSISPHTVDTHLRRVYTKLNVSDRVTAALRSEALGLV